VLTFDQIIVSENSLKKLNEIGIKLSVNKNTQNLSVHCETVVIKIYAFYRFYDTYVPTFNYVQSTEVIEK
jgi:hypothetical protein